MKVTLPMILALVAATNAEGRRYRVLSTPTTTAHHRHPLDASMDLVADMLGDSPMYNIMANTLMRGDPITTTGNNNNLASAVSPRYAVSQDTGTGTMTLRMELPGVSAADLDIGLENDTLLRIQGKRHTLHDAVMEFEQSFQLDSDVDPESLKVTLRHGILEIKASKRVKKVQRLEIIQTDDDTAQTATKPVAIEGKAEEANPADDLTITEEEA